VTVKRRSPQFWRLLAFEAAGFVIIAASLLLAEAGVVGAYLGLLIPVAVLAYMVISFVRRRL
jgi:hypothetical protein